MRAQTRDKDAWGRAALLPSAAKSQAGTEPETQHRHGAQPGDVSLGHSCSYCAAFPTSAAPPSLLCLGVLWGLQGANTQQYRIWELNGSPAVHVGTNVDVGKEGEKIPHNGPDGGCAAVGAWQVWLHPRMLSIACDSSELPVTETECSGSVVSWGGAGALLGQGSAAPQPAVLPARSSLCLSSACSSIVPLFLLLSQPIRKGLGGC